MNRNFLKFILALVISLVTFVTGNVQADPLDNWHWKNPIPQGNALRGVTFGSNKFVAVGDYGTILTSTDLGINWNNRTALNSGSAGTRDNLRAITFGNIGGSGVAAPGFVAVGDNGTILKSTDGSSWTLDSTSGVTANLNSIACGVDATLKQSFVAVGADGTVIRTFEGTSWSKALHAEAMTGEVLNGIVYGSVQNTFVAVSNNGNIFYSIDNGDTWTKSPDSNSSRPLKGVSFVKGNYIAIGSAGAIISSPDGITWTVQNSGTAADLYAVTYGAINDTHVVVGSVSKIIGSTTGFTSWRSFPFPAQETPSNYNLLAVTNDGDKTFIAVGEYGEILRYNPGTALAAWTSINTGSLGSNVNALAYNTNSSNTGATFNLYAATMGGWGVSFTSDAGANWSAKNTGLVSWNVNTLALYPGATSATDTLYAGTASGLHKSIDGGTVWGIIIPPANIKVTAGDKQATISWSAATGATSYKIYRSTTSGVTKTPGNLIASVAGTSYTDNNPLLTNGTSYYYAVTATIANQESTLSSQVSAVPQALAVYVPDNVAVTAGDARNTITWLPVAGATSYNLSIDGVKSSATSPHIDSSLINGTNHSYSVTAVNVVRAVVSSSAVTESTIAWAGVAGATSYNVTINGVAVANVTTSPYLFAGVVNTHSITAVGGPSDGNIILSNSSVSKSTLTWASPAVEPTTYTITINGAVQPIQNAPLTSYDFLGVINPGFTVFSTKDESPSSSIVGATPQATPIQLTSVNTVIVDPVNSNTIYLGNNSGLYKSTDAGLSFSELPYDAAPTSFANVNAITVDKTAANIIYVGGTGGLGAGIYKSINGGTSWTLLKSGTVNTIVIDPLTATTIYLGTTSGAYKSSDSGTTWNVTNPGLGSFSVNYFGINPIAPNIIYMGTDLGIYVTYNSGTDWSGFSNGLTSAVVNAIAFDPGKTEQIYAGTSAGGMYKLTDVFNINWSTRRNDFVFDSTFKSSRELYGIAFGAENFVAVGNSNTIALLGNSSLANVAGEFRAVVYADNTFLAVGGKGADGVVYGSDTVGALWGEHTLVGGLPLVTTGLNAITYGNGTAVAAGLSGTILTISGNSTTKPASGVTTHLRAAAFGNGVFVVAGDGGAVVTSGDSAAWTVRNSGITTQINALGYGNGSFVAVGAGGVILTSIDNGVSWQSVASPTTGNLYGVAYGNGVFVAVGEDAVHGTVLTSTDGGATWSARPSGTVHALYAVAFGKGQFYASGRFGTVIMSDTVPSAAATITSTTPAAGATVIPVNSLITVTFSANMNKTKVEDTANFSITPSITGASITYDSTNFRATISHTSALAYSTNYKVTLTTDIADAAGNNLPVNYSWQFTTESKPDDTHPTIESSTPGNPTTPGMDVAVTDAIKVTFKESDVDPLTINSNTFKLTGPSNQNISVNRSNDGITYILQPTAPLAKGATYTVTVTTGVKDISGNALETPYTWTFKTLDAYTVTVSTGSNGTIAPGTLTLDKNSSQVYTVTPASGFAIDTLTLDGASIKNQLIGNTYTLSNVTAIHAMAATFKPVFQVQTTVAGGSGSITGSPVLDSTGKITIDSGTALTLTITPSTGLSLASLSDNGVLLNLSTLPANLAKGVQNQDGTYTWTYSYASVTADHTIAAVLSQDVTPPAVSVTSPALNSKTVGINDSITVTFNKLIDPTTITSSTFLVREELTGISVLSTPLPSLSGLTATFKPSIPLKAGIKYEAIITTGVKDIVTPANSMAAAYIWTFTTRDATHAVTLNVGVNGSVVSSPVTATSPVTSVTLPANSVVTVSDNNSAVFTITPDVGYSLSLISVDGAAVATPSPSANGVYSFTLSNVMADQAIIFTFLQGTSVNYIITANTAAKALLQDDTNNQLVNLTLFGVSTSNTDNNTLFWSLSYGTNYNRTWVCDTQDITTCYWTYSYCDAQGLNCYYSTRFCSAASPCPELSLYKSQTRQAADLVARGQIINPSGSKPSGMIALIPQNNSGLSGYVDVENYTSDDTNSLNIINITVDNGGSITPFGIIPVALGANQSFEIAPVQGFSVYDLKIGTPPVSLFTKAGRQAVISSLAVDPQTPATIYQGTGSGLYKSIDSGSSWKLIINGISDTRIRTIVIDPVTPNILYTGTEAGVFKSLNSGDSWTKINSSIGGATVSAIAIDSKNSSIVYIGTPGGVYKTSNSGTTWAISNSGLNNASVNSLVIDPVVSSTIYAATLGGVFKSTDSGASWSAVNKNLDDLSINSIAIDPTNSSKMFVGTNNGVYASTDSAGTWTLASSGLPDTGVVSSLIIDPSNTTTLYAGTLAGVFMSKDSGLTWLAKYKGFMNQNSATTNALAMSSSPSAIYAGTINGSYKSTDNAENWVLLNKTFSLIVENITSDKTLVASFGIDTTPPTVISTLPKKNAKNVDPKTTVSVTFSESMLSSSINTNTFLVKDSLNNTIAGTVSLDASATIATFTPLPSSTFSLGSNYTAIITSGATDQAANPLFAQYTWTFSIHSAIHAVTLSTVVNGSVTSIPAVVDKVITVNDTASAVITITPAAGDATSSYKLESIIIDGVAITTLPAANADGTYTYTLSNVLNDHTVAVSLVSVPKIKYRVFAIPNTNADISGLPALDSTGTVTVSDGDTVVLTLKPKVGYTLASLTDNGTALNLVTPATTLVKAAIAADGTNTWTYTLIGVKADRTIKAIFSNAYTISVTAGAGGAVSPGNTTVSYGNSQLFTILPTTGYKFDVLMVNGVPTALTDPVGLTYLLTNVTANMAIDVEFAKYPYNINIVSPVSGTGVVNPSGTVYLNSGDTKSVEITPSNGYALGSITFNGTNVTPVNPPAGKYVYTTPPVTTDSTLVVTYKLLSYAITMTSDGNGVISSDAQLDANGKSFVNHNGSVAFTIVTKPGYSLDTLTVDGVLVPVSAQVKDAAAGTYQYTYIKTNITKDCTVNATYVLTPKTITSSINDNSLGSIAPSGATSVNSGSSQKYQITAVAGAILDDLLVDGVSVKAQVVNDAYTFDNVLVNHTIVANFKKSGTAATTTYPDGDINLDGKLDISDVLLVLQMSVGVRVYTSTDLLHGDVGPMNAQNKPGPDGKIDINDVVVLLQRVVGSIPAW